jgi:hypothetical protein
MDISAAMLDIAVGRGCAEEGHGDVLRSDMGMGFGFRAGSFDGAVSVSALQWLCYNDRKDHHSVRRLDAFFTSLYRCLRRGARAALQFYPENEGQLELVTAVAKRCGFSGGLVVDFPNSTKAKKYYLCIFAGNNDGAGAGAGGGAGGGGRASSVPHLPRALEAGDSRRAGAASNMEGDEDEEDEDVDEEEEEDEEDDGRRTVGGRSSAGGAGAASSSSSSSVHYAGGRGGAGAGSGDPAAERAARHRRREPKVRAGVKSKAWIQGKKEARARKEVASTGGQVPAGVLHKSKYTGRKRGPRF